MKKQKNIRAALRRRFRVCGPRRKPDRLYLSLCVILSAVFVVYVGCRCNLALLRTVSSVWDIITSIGYYGYNFYAVLFETENKLSASVVKVSITSDNVLFPQTFEAFKLKLDGFWSLFVSKENVKGFFANFPEVIYNFSIALMFGLPIVLLFVLLVRMTLDDQNTDTDVVTTPLQR